MKSMIFYTENAEFKLDQNIVRNHLIGKHTEYAPDEVTQLLALISIANNKAIICSTIHQYFGYVILDLIGTEAVTIKCRICDKIYGASKLEVFEVGYGNRLFETKLKRKGRFRLFEKRKMPSLFGGKGYKCPEGHKLISMETWRT